jgi:hypothetical protein
MFTFDGISQYCNNFEDFNLLGLVSKYFMQFLEISWDFGILPKIFWDF